MIFGIIKIVCALLVDLQPERLIRLGQLWRKLLTQSCFLYGEQQIYLILLSVDILKILAEQECQPDMLVVI